MPYVSEEFLKAAVKPVADALSPQAAYLLGKLEGGGGHRMSKVEVEICRKNGWADGEGYIYRTAVGEAIASHLDIEDPPEPEQPSEPEPEPVQPSAPTFTPDPEPVKPTLHACVTCSAPKVHHPNGRCSDCITNATPTGETK